MCSYIDKLDITTVQRRWTGQVLIVIFFLWLLFRLTGINDEGHHLDLFRNTCTYKKWSQSLQEGHAVRQQPTAVPAEQPSSSLQAAERWQQSEVTTACSLTHSKNSQRPRQEDRRRQKGKRFISPSPPPCNPMELRINLPRLPQAWKENRKSYIYLLQSWKGRNQADGKAAAFFSSFH